MTSKPTYFYWPTLVTLLVFFSVGLIVNKTVNLCFYLLLLIGVAQLLQRGALVNFWQVCKRYWPINLAMMGIISAVLINQLSSGHLISRLFDFPSRLGLFAFIFWICLQLPPRWLTAVKWGWISGAIFCTIQLYLMDKPPDGRPTLNVWYVELMTLLGVFSLLSIAWNDFNNKLLPISLQLIAGIGVFYSVYISETRGIWVAIPLFLLMMYATWNKNWQSGKNLLVFSVIVIVLGIALSNTELVRKRIQIGKEDIQLYTSKTNPDTSLGTRFQVWQAAWLMFTEYPVMGVGRENYTEVMQNLAERHIITPAAASFLHSHNEILYNMMTLGVVGLIGILLFYFVPAYYFAKELRHPDRTIRASAAMGVSLCLGYFVFGLVDVMLLYKAPNVFYSLSAALLLAHIANQKQT